MKLNKILGTVIIAVILFVSVFSTMTFAATQRKLTQEELMDIEDFINEYYGITTPYYNNVEEMDLSQALYDGLDNFTEEEKNYYISQEGEILEGDVTKASTTSIKNWYKTVTGKELTTERINSDLVVKGAWKYFEQYDAYYMARSDTSHDQYYTMYGETDTNGNYLVQYVSKYEEYESEARMYGESKVLTLKKVGNSYNVISNKSKSDVNFKLENVADSKVQERALTSAELKSIEDFLNKNENNGIIRTLYTNVENMDLGLALRDLGSINERTDISDEERAWIFAKLGDHTEVFALRELEVKDWYRKITGKILRNVTARMTEVDVSSWEYSTEYNTYYKMHGDTDYREVKAIRGKLTEDGNYLVEYHGYVYNADKYEDFYDLAITLRKVGDSYQAISNQMAEDVNFNIGTSSTSEEGTKTTESTDTKKDDTTASKPIPKTGQSLVAIVAAVGVAVIVMATFAISKIRK